MKRKNIRKKRKGRERGKENHKSKSNFSKYK